MYHININVISIIIIGILRRIIIIINFYSIFLYISVSSLSSHKHQFKL